MKSEECSKYIAVLTIAGSDCSGGAGIQADIKTISALGCYAASAITAVTVQNTQGVTAVHAVPPEIVAGQIRAVMDDIKPKAVKIGMVNDAETIKAIADALADYDIEHIVVDPVMVSTSGSKLMQDDAIKVFIEKLLPMSTLITPNIYEAEILAGKKITDEDAMNDVAGEILSKGAEAVLIKGGHIEGDKKVDLLYNAIRKTEARSSEITMMIGDSFESETVETRNTHGTGCTLSAAIASNLAMGLGINKAIDKAKYWLTSALIAGADVEIGSGHGPVNHFYAPKKMRIIYND
ncbi:MAG: bifunctional hydroxymethylpyrimidine kinase/phosphomethylpyrimidine kinase [Prevotella sp.]|nr:bifunctional hydroxymethylpyrimidine kinase/phosphomethylpyrimidine kinase [Prevotella sp.]